MNKNGVQLSVANNVGRLVLTRRIGEAFYVGNDVRIEIGEASPGRCKIVVTAPRDVAITREELLKAKPLRMEPRREQGRSLRRTA